MEVGEGGGDSFTPHQKMVDTPRAILRIAAAGEKHICTLLAARYADEDDGDDEGLSATFAKFAAMFDAMDSVLRDKSLDLDIGVMTEYMAGLMKSYPDPPTDPVPFRKTTVPTDIAATLAKFRTVVVPKE